MSADRRHDRRRSRLAIVALFSILATIAAPAAALAESAQIKLALLPIGQPRSYFDLTLRPGESRTFKVEIANHGNTALAARTYAADVYTIVNGGFGGRLRGESRTGTTGWIRYPTEVVRLPAGKVINRSFTVTVPADAGPGEYITSLVLENDQPIHSGGAVSLNQIVRQAIAVVVTVPGRRSPALEIGQASHTVVAGKSVVAVAIENTGNVRLKPVADFTLFNQAGAQLSLATVPMDTFYAHTSSSIEIPLAALLAPGAYTVRLTLEDAARGARAVEASLTFVVAEPRKAAEPDGAGPGLVEVIEDGGSGDVSLPVRSVVLVLGLLLAIALAWMDVHLRRRRTS